MHGGGDDLRAEGGRVGGHFASVPAGHVVAHVPQNHSIRARHTHLRVQTSFQTKYCTYEYVRITRTGACTRLKLYDATNIFVRVRVYLRIRKDTPNPPPVICIIKFEADYTRKILKKFQITSGGSARNLDIFFLKSAKRCGNDPIAREFAVL